MKLIVGLGNPGAQYDGTRHNVGFMAIDAFAEGHGATFKLEPKLKGMLATVVLDGKKALLLKPQTFMNLSGQSVRLVMSYYKIAVEDILVISDDLDSPTGRVRLRSNGSAGGHNGHKSIIEWIGTQEYKRIKIGIDRSNIISVVDWVLQKFSKEELALESSSFEKTNRAIRDFISEIPYNKIASLYSGK